MEEGQCFLGMHWEAVSETLIAACGQVPVLLLP